MSKPSLGRIVASAPVPQPTTNFAPIWLMDALGYSEEEGIDLRIELAGTPKDAADAVISGRGDLTFINIVFTLLARDRGVPLRPFYGFVRGQNRSFSVPCERSLADWQLSARASKQIGLAHVPRCSRHLSPC